MGPDGVTAYTQNRTAVHLHGGFTPWISDGTPYQWITPAGETGYTTGASLQNVPDMPDPGPGAATNYYTNQQSNRLMFYHEHAVGITRLGVYGGLAAGYLITDPQEEALINAGTIPNRRIRRVYRYGIPLIIQDKTFVPEMCCHPGYRLGYDQLGGATAISGGPTSMSRTRMSSTRQTWGRTPTAAGTTAPGCGQHPAPVIRAPRSRRLPLPG